MHHLAGLRFDAVGQRQRIMRRIVGELASLGQPAISFDDVAVRGQRLGCARDQVAYRSAYDRSPAPSVVDIARQTSTRMGVVL